jgi:hypothetical protein
MNLNPVLLEQMTTDAYNHLYKKLHQQTVDLRLEVTALKMLGKTEEEIKSAVAPKMDDLHLTKAKLKIAYCTMSETKGENFDVRCKVVSIDSRRKAFEGHSRQNVQQG